MARTPVHDRRRHRGRDRRSPEAADRRPARRLTPGEIGIAAQIACLLEVSAPKPGNVTPTRVFADTRYEDFLLSAAAIGPALAGAGNCGVGETILRAVRETRRVISANTNLGIVLLFAPLARAAASWQEEEEETLREALVRVLAELTVPDAACAYAAIRQAGPGGLGAAEQQDVGAEPTVTLREAMALAAERDAIAREYVTDYFVTFEKTVPALERARASGLGWSDAVVQAYLEVLAEFPDTLIARKVGRPFAEAVSGVARSVVGAGGLYTEEGRKALSAFDRDLRDDGNRWNPGTTADLVAAGLFVMWLTREEGEAV